MGCATNPEGDKPKGVSIPRDCEELSRTVPQPGKHRDARVYIGRLVITVDAANSNLDATRKCLEEQREKFAKGS